MIKTVTFINEAGVKKDLNKDWDMLPVNIENKLSFVMRYSNKPSVIKEEEIINYLKDKVKVLIDNKEKYNGFIKVIPSFDENVYNGILVNFIVEEMKKPDKPIEKPVDKPVEYKKEKKYDKPKDLVN